MTVTTGTSGGRRAPSVDATLRNVVVGFRLLAWVWMTVLVGVALAVEDEATVFWIIAAEVVATVWTGITVWCRRSPVLGQNKMMALDTVAALFIASSSSLAGADALFHGGMPISWIVSAAYVGGFRYAMPASIVIGAHQVAVHIIDERGVSGAAGSLVFPVFAIVVGLLYDTSRETERARDEAMAQLHEARNEQVRHEERNRLANVLHDSVLQTLNAIQSDAGDADQVRYLARRQDRELRRTITEYQSEYSDSMRARLFAARDDIEDTFRVAIETSVRGDCHLTEERRIVCQATREALTNAAKHAGVDSLDLYAELDEERVYVFVRDRGSGFDVASMEEARGGMVNSVVKRVETIGGRLRLESELGEGTLVSIELPAPAPA